MFKNIFIFVLIVSSGNSANAGFWSSLNDFFSTNANREKAQQLIGKPIKPTNGDQLTTVRINGVKYTVPLSSPLAPSNHWNGYEGLGSLSDSEKEKLLKKRKQYGPKSKWKSGDRTPSRVTSTGLVKIPGLSGWRDPFTNSCHGNGCNR